MLHYLQRLKECRHDAESLPREPHESIDVGFQCLPMQRCTCPTQCGGLLRAVVFDPSVPALEDHLLKFSHPLHISMSNHKSVLLFQVEANQVVRCTDRASIAALFETEAVLLTASSDQTTHMTGSTSVVRRHALQSGLRVKDVIQCSFVMPRAKQVAKSCIATSPKAWITFTLRWNRFSFVSTYTLRRVPSSLETGEELWDWFAPPSLQL
jgi:hypothetical protein